MRKLNLKHNQKVISSPLQEAKTVCILFNRHADGSMDLIFRGDKDVWYYTSILPEDEIIISQGVGDNNYPKPQTDYEQLAELHHYSVLKNRFDRKIELHNDIPELGVELTTKNGILKGFVQQRVINLSITFCRGEVMVQFGAMNIDTFELFTWYYSKMAENESLHIKIKEIPRDSDHLTEFPSQMKIPPTPKELSENKIKQEELLQRYKLKFNDK